MRRAAIAALAVTALAGALAIALRDDGHGLDLEAISDCTRPRVHPRAEHLEVDLDLGVALEPVADLETPTAIDTWPDGRLVVAERAGRVVLLAEDGTTNEILDISDRIALNAEGGIIGLAVEPSGRHLYVHHTDLEGTSHVLSFGIDGGELEVSDERDLLQQPHPGLVHNGGQLLFGPDDHLYIGFGDGSQQVSTALASASPDTLAGKILRIEPTPEADQPYRIPADNPDPDGDRGRPEIWASGFRNPWRFDFDEATGDLWIGDVGNDCWEEINVVPAGAAGLDFGWPRYEGDHGLAADEDDGASTWPSHTIRHGTACAVIGGTVYRGEAIPELFGRYVYGDLCAGDLSWLEVTEDGTRGGPMGLSQRHILALWADEGGEIHVLTAEDGLLRLVATSQD